MSQYGLNAFLGGMPSPKPESEPDLLPTRFLLRCIDDNEQNILLGNTQTQLTKLYTNKSPLPAKDKQQLQPKRRPNMRFIMDDENEQENDENRFVTPQKVAELDVIQQRDEGLGIRFGVEMSSVERSKPLLQEIKSVNVHVNTTRVMARTTVKPIVKTDKPIFEIFKDNTGTNEEPNKDQPASISLAPLRPSPQPTKTLSKDLPAPLASAIKTTAAALPGTSSTIASDSPHISPDELLKKRRQIRSHGAMPGVSPMNTITSSGSAGRRNSIVLDQKSPAAAVLRDLMDRRERLGSPARSLASAIGISPTSLGSLHEQELTNKESQRATIEQDLAVEELAKVQARKVALEQELAKATASLEKMKSDSFKTEQDLAKAKEDLGKMRIHTAKTEEELSKSKQNLDKAQGEKSRLESTIMEQTIRIKRLSEEQLAKNTKITELEEQCADAQINLSIERDAAETLGVEYNEALALKTELEKQIGLERSHAALLESRLTDLQSLKSQSMQELKIFESRALALQEINEKLIVELQNEKAKAQANQTKFDELVLNSKTKMQQVISLQQNLELTQSDKFRVQDELVVPSAERSLNDKHQIGTDDVLKSELNVEKERVLQMEGLLAEADAENEELVALLQTNNGQLNAKEQEVMNLQQEIQRLHLAKEELERKLINLQDEAPNEKDLVNASTQSVLISGLGTLSDDDARHQLNRLIAHQCDLAQFENLEVNYRNSLHKELAEIKQALQTTQLHAGTISQENARLQNRIAELDHQLQESSTQIQSLKEVLDERTRNQCTSLENSLREKSNELEALKLNLEREQVCRSSLEAEMSELRSQLDENAQGMIEYETKLHQLFTVIQEKDQDEERFEFALRSKDEELLKAVKQHEDESANARYQLEVMKDQLSKTTVKEQDTSLRVIQLTRELDIRNAEMQELKVRLEEMEQEASDMDGNGAMSQVHQRGTEKQIQEIALLKQSNGELKRKVHDLTGQVKQGAFQLKMLENEKFQLRTELNMLRMQCNSDEDGDGLDTTMLPNAQHPSYNELLSEKLKQDHELARMRAEVDRLTNFVREYRQRCEAKANQDKQQIRILESKLAVFGKLKQGLHMLQQQYGDRISASSPMILSSESDVLLSELFSLVEEGK